MAALLKRSAAINNSNLYLGADLCMFIAPLTFQGMIVVTSAQNVAHVLHAALK